MAKKAGVSTPVKTPVITGKKRDRHRRPRAERRMLEGPAEPKNERDMIFCQQWLVHRDAPRAYRAAGFSEKNNGGPAGKLKRFAAYLEVQRRKFDQKVQNELTYERKDILDSMAAIAMANPQDYLVPITWMETINGKEVERKGLGMRELMSLPRHMAAAVEEFHCDPTTGRVTYRMPSLDTKAKLLKILGENTGAIKRDPGEGKHFHLHFKGVTDAQLEQAESQLIASLGKDVVRAMLGGQQDDDPIDG